MRLSPTQQVCLILLAASTLRLATWYGGLPNEGRYTETDSADYLTLARNLLDEGQFGKADQPEIFRTPGYPAFLVPFSIVGFPLALICLVQITLDVPICFLVWCVARRHFGQETALPALVFQAFSLVSVVYACRVLSETVFTLLLMPVFPDTLCPAKRRAQPTMGSGCRRWCRSFVRDLCQICRRALGDLPGGGVTLVAIVAKYVGDRPRVRQLDQSLPLQRRHAVSRPERHRIQRAARLDQQRARRLFRAEGQGIVRR